MDAWARWWRWRTQHMRRPRWWTLCCHLPPPPSPTSPTKSTVCTQATTRWGLSSSQRAHRWATIIPHISILSVIWEALEHNPHCTMPTRKILCVQKSVIYSKSQLVIWPVTWHVCVQEEESEEEDEFNLSQLEYAERMADLRDMLRRYWNKQPVYWSPDLSHDLPCDRSHDVSHDRWCGACEDRLHGSGSNPEQWWPTFDVVCEPPTWSNAA